MTDTSQVDNDRQRLAAAGAAILGPLLVRHVNRFIADELTPVPDGPLSNRALNRWRTTLYAAIGADLAILLAEDATDQWAGRGLPVPSGARIDRDTALAVRLTVAGTDNLAQTLADSAAGKEGSAALETLVDPVHQELVGSSLTMTGSDVLFDRYAASDELTGRRRWVVADPENSRHGALDGEIAEPGAGFSLGDIDISGPREDPADVAMWSNCTCSVEYELADGTWL